jgi:cytosine/adenosine deaminase-related metal-dependent hydrolase
VTRILLRGAQVITMAPGRPDSERIDVLIEDNLITCTGADLESAGADVVDLHGRIVIPGLVNAHLHTWQTALRLVGADWTLPQYFTHVRGRIAPHYRPDDVHISNLVGALNQINCGTTTLGDWCHNNPTPEHSDAAVAALQSAGIRAVFLHGSPNRAPDVGHPLEEVDRLIDVTAGSASLVNVGMAILGPQLSTPDVAVADFRAAAERGVLASMHQSGGLPAPAWDAVRRAGLFGPTTNVVHGEGLTEEWIKLLVDAGVTFTITPENELGHGHGQPITAPLLRYGAAPSLGIDTETAIGGELLTAARVALAHQRGLDHEHSRRITGAMAATPTVTCKQALSWATVEGARALGVGDRVGRIEPGMQADVVAIDARALNLWPVHDPVATALHAGVGNIEAVIVAGKWRKREHRLIGVDLDELKNRLLESGDRLGRLLSDHDRGITT